MTTGTAQSKRKTKEIISFPFSRKFSFNSESSSSLRLCLIPGHLQMCEMKLWKATACATASERRSTKLTDKRQLCAALPCVALQHPVRILPRKTVLLILKINQLYSTKAQRVPKNARLGSLGTWSAHCYFRNDLSGYGVHTKTMAYRFRIVFKSFHFFYRLRIVFKSLRIRIVFV